MNLNSVEIRNTVITGIETVITDAQMAPANYGHSKPPYPFGTIDVITPMIAQAGEDIIVTSLVPGTGGFDNDMIETYQQTPEMTMTINAYGIDETQASDLAYRLYDWFSVQGELYLDDFHIAVVEVLDIEQRDFLIQDEYERRFGFDARLRYTRNVERSIQTIENNETRRIE